MDYNLLKSELSYKYVRSSGSGGQHVNKVSSKAELYFDLKNSIVFNDEEKQKLVAHISPKIINSRGFTVGEIRPAASWLT